MSRQAINQVSTGAAPGDAITAHALQIQRWLRQAGYASELFAEHIHPDMARHVRPMATYRPRGGERWVIYHHSIGSPCVPMLLQGEPRLIMIYHNVTPPEFFAGIDPQLVRQMELGRDQLRLMVDSTDLALGVSTYNEAELRSVGYARTGVLPLILDASEYRSPIKPTIEQSLAAGRPRLLFVGRQVPNKRQDDLLKLMYYLRRIRPDAQLILVGGEWLPAYGSWLHDLAADLGVSGNVQFTGFVSQEQLTGYYRLADLYLSMSEHEGFGKPFIESMYLGLPVMAYAAAGVPDTIGDAGILFHRKDYEALAELVDLVLANSSLCNRLISRGRVRAESYLEPAVRSIWQEYLQSLQEGTHGNL